MGLLVDTLLHPNFGLRSTEAVGGTVPETVNHDLHRLQAALRVVPRFALNGKSTRFVESLPKSLTPAQAVQARLPYGAFWVEAAWEDSDLATGRKSRYGILYLGYREEGGVFDSPEEAIDDGALDRGAMIVVMEDGHNTATVSLALAIPDAVSADPEVEWGALVKMQGETYQSLRQWMGGNRVTLDEENLPTKDDITDDADLRVLAFLRKVGLFMCSFGIVMASPKVHDREEVDMARLNKKRTRAGKPTLCDHTVIRITADPPPPRIRPGETGAEIAEPGKRMRHPVRFFTRIKGGKLETVRPHWRGDEALGTKTGNYRVR